MSFWLMVAAVAAAPAPASSAAIKPKLISGSDSYPYDARSLGHHGKVVARATVTVDGSLKDITIQESSKSPLLDNHVLNVLRTWKLSPAKDSAGNPIEVTAIIPFEYKGDGQPGGYLIRYRCSAFLRDMTWWRSVNPRSPDTKHEMYSMLLGLRVIAHPGGMMAGLASKKASTDAQADWAHALSECNTKPDSLMIDHLKIASLIRRLTAVENGQRK